MLPTFYEARKVKAVGLASAGHEFGANGCESQRLNPRPARVQMPRIIPAPARAVNKFARTLGAESKAFIVCDATS